MGGEDDVNAAVAHIVLCCVAGKGSGRMFGRSYAHPGMHANFFIHGVLGFLNNQTERFGNDFKPAYDISLKATRYLALPCLNADLYRGDSLLSTLHLLSGLIPFAMAISGNENAQLGNVVLACNLLSLANYSLQNNKEWGWFTAGAGVFAYYMTPKLGSTNVLYPLGLAMMDYCASKMTTISIANLF